MLSASAWWLQSIAAQSVRCCSARFSSGALESLADARVVRGLLWLRVSGTAVAAEDQDADDEEDEEEDGEAAQHVATAVSSSSMLEHAE